MKMTASTVTLIVYILFTFNLGQNNLLSPDFVERPFLSYHFPYETSVFWSLSECEEAKERAKIETFCISAYLIP